MLNHLELAAEPFRAQGLNLEEQLRQGAPHDQLPGYVNHGCTSYLYQVEGRPELVMRLPYADDDSSMTPEELIMEYVEPLARGLGHTGLEQVVAFSTRDPAITVSVKAGVKGLDEAVKDGTIAQVRTGSYLKLLLTFKEMYDRQVTSEHPAPQHFRLDRAHTFTVIDYRTSEDLKQILSQDVIHFAQPGSLVADPESYNGILPIQAIRYRRAVRHLMGARMAGALHNEWKSHGFEIPRRWELFL